MEEGHKSGRPRGIPQVESTADCAKAPVIAPTAVPRPVDLERASADSVGTRALQVGPDRLVTDARLELQGARMRCNLLGSPKPTVRVWRPGPQGSREAPSHGSRHARLLPAPLSSMQLGSPNFLMCGFLHLPASTRVV
jgi:hypothetical protein